MMEMEKEDRMEESFEQFREGKKNMKEKGKGFKWCVTAENSEFSNGK